jgi:hypothetical protein
MTSSRTEARSYTSTAAAARPVPRLSLRSSAAALHWISLAVGLVFLLWVNRHQWFHTDEWAFVVARGVFGSARYGLFEPHGEHWSTIPIVIWRSLFSVFGVRTYLPYLLLLIGMHLLAAHLLWRVTLRVGVNPLLATLAVTPFVVLGAGWENLTAAFQFSLIGSLVAGLAALLVAPTRGPFGKRDAVGWALNIVGLMFSGLGVTMVVVAGLSALFRRGVRVALLTVSVPAAVYLLWYATYGRDVGETAGTEPFKTAVRHLPAYAWRGLADSINDVTGLSGIGPVVLLLLVLFVGLRVRSLDATWALAVAMAAGAVLFIAFAGIRRSGLGPEHAAAPRYVYVIAALLLPLAAVAVEWAVARSPLRLALVLGITIVLLVVQVSKLNTEASKAADIEQEAKHRILATAQLLREHVPLLGQLPVLVAFDLTTPDIARLDREGRLPGNVRVTKADLLTARAYLDIVLLDQPVAAASGPLPRLSSIEGATITAAARPDCIVTTARAAPAKLVFDFPGQTSHVLLQRPTNTQFDFVVRSEAAQSRPRHLGLVAGTVGVLTVRLQDLALEMPLPPLGPTTVCGLDPASIQGAAERAGGAAGSLG